MRLAALGALLGAVVALLAFAPASWLAGWLADASSGRLLLADARGTVWRGSAVLVLTGGAGSRDASALPGRLQWTIGVDGAALGVRAQHACCINGTLRLRVRPGVDRLRVELAAHDGAVGQWPAEWLAGLGTPWNTLQPSGSLQLSSPGLGVESVHGRWRFDGRADIELASIASRVSRLPVLGSYRLELDAAASGDDAATLRLSTLEGPLLLDGRGEWAGDALRFRGEARAAAGFEAALNNLLNIIGRRNGATSVIAIG